MSNDEKTKIIQGFKKNMINDAVDIYDKFPDFMKHLDDNFWDLLLDTNEKYEPRKQFTGFNK